MNQEMTWSNDKLRCLLDIWADDHVAQQLDEKHSNHEVQKCLVNG